LVYIKRIDLRGFKTFGKKATVHLDRGLTIVTGPNGSGKSNILDSVKFALGELSPKELRGETIGDLVHKGAQAATTRSAWVAVQFDNHDRRIPIDAEAVTISREFRRGGEGIYRLNGRRISRKQLTDILSSADIQVSSYNIVPQHAITRLAEVTTEERRKIIEDMIGIGVYDVKKASSQAELQKADVNLQVASAKIEEVRLRVESLEKERNNYLKFQQIRKELSDLQAKSVSYKIRAAREKVNELEQKIHQIQQQIQELKSKRDQLIQERTRVESEKREYEDSVAVKGSSRLLDAQRAMGDLSATIARLGAHRDAIQTNITTLQQQKAELELNSRKLNDRIISSKNEIAELNEDHESLLNALNSKQASVENSRKALTKVRERSGERDKEAEEIENNINQLTQRIMKFNSQINASTAKIEIQKGHLQTLTARKEEYASGLNQISKRLEDLKTAMKEEEERALNAAQKISEYTSVKEQRSKEIENAAQVAKKATLALTEIETRTNMAHDFASDDKALRLIEEMAEAGTVSGVYGRIGDLVKVRSGDLKAVEAAAAGWLKAIVVKDIETAISCIEVLKRTKIGRVKLVPLKGLAAPSKKPTPTNLQDIIGPVGEQLDFQPQFQPAIDYVFGDTVLARNQKAAFLASLQGIRAVAPSGDLYEPGGAMETGYFRQPLDMSRILLHDRTVEQLKRTLSSLESLTRKAKDDIARIEEEILEQTNTKSRSLNLTQVTQKEIASVTENLERTHKVVNETAARVEQLSREIVTEQTVLATCDSRKRMLEGPMSEYERSRGALRSLSQPSALSELEKEHAKLTDEANQLLKRKIETEGRIQAVSSTILAIEPTVEQTMNQITTIDSQLVKLDSQLKKIEEDLPQYERDLEATSKSREQITEELASVKEKRQEYDEQLRAFERQITEILEELDPLNTNLADETASSKQMHMQIDFHVNELKELGCAEAEVSEEEIERVEKMIPVLKKELGSIGGINELAASQYEEVKGNYKQLASRIYDLEKEKLSIVKFMNELDTQKLEAFMKAFTQVSNSFNEIFSTVTSGVGQLFLEKPESPFEAGADIKLQFPGKTSMSIGSASGGEKSVGTVCFILALQAIHPMPFYMMDEIDAHLDIVNSQKLAELLKSKSKGSQFIVVSLKDVTISRADAVYGVFIQQGVSQVVTLPMQEVRMVGRNN